MAIVELIDFFRAKKYNYDSDEILDDDDDEEDYMPAKRSKKKNPAKRSIDFDQYSNTPKGAKGRKRKSAPATASRSSGRAPAKKPVKYNEDSDDEEEDEEEEQQYYQPPIKKGRKSAPASKKSSSKKGGRQKNKSSKYYDPSEVNGLVHPNNT